MFSVAALHKANEVINKGLNNEAHLFNLDPVGGGALIITAHACSDYRRENGRDYSVHTYYRESDALYNGSYNLTYDEAAEEHKARVAKALGY